MQFATMALSINDIITKVDDWVWGWVLIVLILNMPSATDL